MSHGGIHAVELTAHERRLQQIGKHLKAIRKDAYRESLAVFAKRLGVTVTTLKSMEDGKPGVRIGTWFLAFDLMQVADGMVEASRPAMVLLANYSAHAESGFRQMLQGEEGGSATTPAKPVLPEK